jgi:tRNA-2-methylthio-N6-dimethylallyladenosine synthase
VVSGRELPVLAFPLQVEGSAGPRVAAAAPDERVGEFRPESRALPLFWMWTLGCQMNRSDSEEMAGRLLAAGCAEAPAMDAAELIIINTCAIREAAEAKVIGRQGVLAALKAANPALRVALTGCAVRERDRAGLRRRFPAVDLFLRPDEEPELVDRLGLASAQAPIGLPATAATTLVKGVPVSAADNLATSRAAAVEAGAVRRSSAHVAWLPIIYGCDKTCTYCIVPFSRGPERSRPFDEVVAEAAALVAAGYKEVTLLGQNVNSYGHDLPAEERFGHIGEARRTGQKLDAQGRPDLAELIRAIDGLRESTTVGGPGLAIVGGPALAASDEPAIPRLRFVTSHPWDLSDRLIEAMATCPSVCQALHLPVQSGSDATLRRMGRQYTIAHYEERLARIREAVPGIATSTDVIVGFCGETDAEYQETLDLLRRIRFDQVFAAAYSERPGTPATRLADDVPAAVKRGRLNGLLGVQEAIGLGRNGERLGSLASVLVDSVERPRAHAHDEDDGDEPASTSLVGLDPFAGPLPAGFVRLAGRSRENKLVHLAGPAELVGRVVEVRIEAAGPYSLRGVLAG